MLTVLNVGQNYHLAGGSDRYLLDLGALLEGRGHRVIPFAAENPKNEPTEWSRYFVRGADLQHPGPVDLARFVYNRPAGRAIARLTRETKPDLAHLHIYYGKLTAAILSPLKRAGVPIVQTMHDFKLICPVYSLVSNGKVCEACEGTHYLRALPRKCNRGSLARTALSVAESYVSRALGSWDAVDQFIAVSRFQRDKVVQYGLPPERVTTIHNFVSADAFRPGSGAGDYFLYFGRLEEGKGVHTLLSAAARVREVPLVLAGTGSAHDALARRIEAEGLGHVRLVGFKQGAELADLVRGSICTLLPVHWYENCPMSILESLAYARPVIASRMGGIPELVRDGEDGFLVASADVDQLADRLRWMADHRLEAAHLGQAGRLKVERDFHAAGHYERLLDVYRRVLPAAALQ